MTPALATPFTGPLLAIDTSGGASVALWRDGEIVAQESNADPRQHTEQLAPMIAKALATAQLKAQELAAIAVANGPAPFTGLRVGLVSAQTMAHALGVPIVGVGSLDALAWRILREQPEAAQVLIANDARRKEVYFGHYQRQGGGVVAITGPAVATPADVVAQFRVQTDPRFGTLPIAGSGVTLYAEQFAEFVPVTAGSVVTAGDIAELAVIRGQQADADVSTQPQYLRRPDIHSSTKKKSALG